MPQAKGCDQLISLFPKGRRVPPKLLNQTRRLSFLIVILPECRRTKVNPWLLQTPRNEASLLLPKEDATTTFTPLPDLTLAMGMQDNLPMHDQPVSQRTLWYSVLRGSGQQWITVNQSWFILTKRKGWEGEKAAKIENHTQTHTSESTPLCMPG